ncbi:germination protein YpeB [Virgibacillus halophilus]|uniref:Germination protein YpeB n=1 Tax=Tigheibacillus halophilus TaxID=361280 RepID=A0ABU5CD42_9BACI|nr:germination protein YpeB [Virgibacillus halophilus]
MQAENTYQRSFHELSYRMDILHDKLGTAIAMNSDSSLSPQMTDIWRVSSEALTNVGQLPLTLLPFNKTEGFLVDVGNFTYKTAIRNLSKEPLSKDETNNLKKLYQQSGNIKEELRDVQHAVLDHNLRWMDVQLALSTQDEKSDNTIIDGLKTVENTASNYANEDNPSPFMQASNKRESFQNLSGTKITKDQALDNGSRYFGVDKRDIKVAKNGKGAALPSYSLSYQDGRKRGYMEMSQKRRTPYFVACKQTDDRKEVEPL